MNSNPKRLYIYTSDVVLITGKTLRYAQMILKSIREHFNKEEKALVLITEFCVFMNLKEEDVLPFL